MLDDVAVVLEGEAVLDEVGEMAAVVLDDEGFERGFEREGLLATTCLTAV